MKIELGKEYRTRDGREVRIYAVDGGGDFPVHGAIKLDDGWASEEWHKEGGSYFSHKSPNDLVEVKPRIKRTVWLNVYKGRPPYCHKTRERADICGSNDRIACIPIEIDCEYGEGL